MKLTDAERDIINRARKALDADPVTALFSPLWVEKLLGIIDRLSQEPEVVRCAECRHSSKIANSTKGERHCWSLRGRNNGDGFSRVRSDGYCDEGDRKEAVHE